MPVEISNQQKMKYVGLCQHVNGYTVSTLGQVISYFSGFPPFSLGGEPTGPKN